MSNLRLEFKCENEKIALRDELKLHVSKKFYKNIKSSNSLILVNNNPKKLFEFINKGDIITVDYIKNDEIEWELYESNLDIIYEDSHYLVVNKRSNLLTIPTKSEPFSLYQEILYYLSKTNQNLNCSILNRLDKETNGLVVVAKDRLSAYYLQPTHEKMVRKYKCLCHGIFDNKSGKIENYINKSKESNKRYISLNKGEGKIAISNYKVIKEFDNYSLVEFVLDTGRTHQIRFHSSYIGHPILGDNMYGIADNYNLALCSYYVRFTDPYTYEIREFEIESGWENGRIE